MQKETVTVEDLQKAFPQRAKAITDEVVEIINKSTQDPEFQGETLMQSAVTYQNVLAQNKVSITEYVNGLRFCAYLMTEDDNSTKAYSRVFYYRDFVKSRVDKPTESNEYKTLVAAASRYRNSKLIKDILTISQVPMDLMFLGHRYKAVGVLANLMETAKMDRDKINAAKELLAATKNENQKIELEIGPNQEAVSMQNQLDKQLSDLALNQKKMLEAGFQIGDVQKTGLQLDVIEGEVE